MAKFSINDLVIIIPGIMGSVLEKNGRVVWDSTAAAVWAGVASGGGSILDLKLVDDDPAQESAVDGVISTKLIDDLVIIPRFWKVDGYTGLYEALTHAFDLEEVAPDDGTPGNLIRFAYDWRRDIRASARRLARVAAAKLELWRRSGGTSKSRVILIAHSMGGLVARYALECEGLRGRARALVTLGTPYRGAPRALDYLVNGRSLVMFGVRFLDLTGVLRSLPSAYQLLPRYPVLETPGGLKRIAEVGEGALGLDPVLFTAQTSFHAELDRATALNRAEPVDVRDPYEWLQVVGVQQPTVVGARWSGGILAPSKELPAGLPGEYPDGDGTVPWLSAMPLDERFRGFFAAQAHESLQDDEGVLADVVARLRYLQAPDTDAYRGTPDRVEKGSLSLEVDDATPVGLPVTIRARTADGPAGDGPGLEALIMPAGGGPGTVVPLTAGEDGWSRAGLSGLSHGLYRASARAAGTARANFRDVTAAFAVVEAGTRLGD
jgi:pimeloyl-ACP methyl ester carboxylesterase